MRGGGNRLTALVLGESNFQLINLKIFTLDEASKANLFQKSKRKAAFTLSEVLITLGIIGVVVAITLPSLVANHQKNVMLTQLRKAYSEVNQAFKLAEIDKGFSDEWDFSEYMPGKERSEIFHKDYLVKYMNVVKSCYPSTVECWANTASISKQENYLNNDGKSPSAITSSGYSIYTWVGANNEHAQIWVDIDVPLKGKNMMGRDVFGMVLYFKGVNSPDGMHRQGLNMKGADFEPLHSRDEIKNNSQYGCSRNINSIYAGHNCGSIIQTDGWKISEDYPWM